MVVRASEPGRSPRATPCFGAVLAALAALVVLALAGPAPRAAASVADVVESAALTGAPAEVFGAADLCSSWVNPDPTAPAEAHKIHDAIDSPARAFRNGRGQTVMLAANRVTRIATGPDLDSVVRRCDAPPAWASPYEDRVWSFDVRTWLTSPHALGDGRVYALLSADYHASLDRNAPATACPSGDKGKCWYNAITWVESSDWGRTFSHPSFEPGEPPRYFVAGLPYRYEPDAGPMGYFSPSNTIRGRLPGGGWDGYYYVLFKAENYRAQEKGTCLMRTSDLSRPRSWRAWDGDGFDVQFVNPYRGPAGSRYPYPTPPADPEAHVCEPVSEPQIGTLHKSVTWNTSLQRYVLVGTDSVRGVEGVYFSTSPNLVDWAPKRLLWQHPLKNNADPPAPADVISYASLLDPASPDRNYTTTGQRPYLYFGKYDWHCDPGDDPALCGTNSRSLMRVPVELTRPG